MKQITVKKGEIIQHKGELGTKVYHVQKGLLRSYQIDDKGKEHIFMFGPEGWVVADSSGKDEPSELYIDALEDSTLGVTEKNMEEEISDPEPIIKRMRVLQKRILMLMSASAYARYEHFIQTYPDILQRVPQRMIASYLGITPEALSKVKGEHARQKS